MEAQAEPLIAIIGGDIAGIAAALTLKVHGKRVILLEKNKRLGGKTFESIDFPLPDGKIHRIDARIASFNTTASATLSEAVSMLGLNVYSVPNDYSVMTKTRHAVIAERDGSFLASSSPGAAKILEKQIKEFKEQALEVLETDMFDDWTLNKYLDHVIASSTLRDEYALPLAMGALPMPNTHPDDMHIKQLVQFWNAEGTLGVSERVSLEGGMHTFVTAAEKRLRADGVFVRMGVDVRSISRENGGATISFADDSGTVFTVKADQVIIATPTASAAAALMKDATTAEQAALEDFATSESRFVVHTDERLMPSDKKMWGCVNYLVPDGSWPVQKPTVTYHLNNISKLPGSVPNVFVSVNPAIIPREDAILHEFTAAQTLAIEDKRFNDSVNAVAVQQGKNRIWWAGAYLKTPDGLEAGWASGSETANLLAGEADSQKEDDEPDAPSCCANFFSCFS